jgi:hypothetical protein
MIQRKEENSDRYPEAKDKKIPPRKGETTKNL